MNPTNYRRPPSKPAAAVILAVAALAVTVGLAACDSGQPTTSAVPSTSPPTETSSGPATTSPPSPEPPDIIFGPTGAGPLKLGMTARQIARTGVATAPLGSREDGWRAGCRVLLYDPGAMGRTPEDTYAGQASRQHGLELIHATYRMVTPEGIHLGSSYEDVRAAFGPIGLGLGRDHIEVPAADGVVYLLRFSDTREDDPNPAVVSLSLGFDDLDCVI